MPRGDLVYKDQPNHGMRKHRGMPPSHNCVWVESNIKEEELSDNWNKVFGKSATTKELSRDVECTCNTREETKNGDIFIVEDFCEIHGAATRKKIVLTDIAKKLPARDRKKAREFLTSYGDTDIREVMNRN